jgi:hypothetical protein
VAFPFPRLIVLSFPVEVVSVPNKVTVKIQCEPELVRTLMAHERVYIFPIVFMAKRVARTSAYWRRCSIPHDDLVRSWVKDSPTKTERASQDAQSANKHTRAADMAGGRSVVSHTPIVRKGFYYGDGISRCEIDNFSIGESRKDMLAQKQERESESEGNG